MTRTAVLGVLTCVAIPPTALGCGLPRPKISPRFPLDCAAAAVNKSKGTRTPTLRQTGALVRVANMHPINTPSEGRSDGSRQVGTPTAAAHGRHNRSIDGRVGDYLACWWK